MIFYGKSGEFATNRRDQQELGMLSPHILQAALVYLNTLMIQDILAGPEWVGVLTAEDLRGLMPLFWAHVLPYGEVRLNMTRRIALNVAQTVETNAELSGRQARTATGGPRPTCHLVPRSLTAPHIVAVPVLVDLTAPRNDLRFRHGVHEELVLIRDPLDGQQEWVRGAACRRRHSSSSSIDFAHIYATVLARVN